MNERNGKNGRLDRIEAGLERLLRSQAAAQREHKELRHQHKELRRQHKEFIRSMAELRGDQRALVRSQVHLLNSQANVVRDTKALLTAQVVLTDMHGQLERAHEQFVAEVGARFAEVAEAQKHTDERVNALINVVDSLIRGQRPESPQ